MSKKTILIISYIIVLIIILIVGAVSIYMYLNNENIPTNIDMNLLDKNMSQEVNLNNSRMKNVTIDNVGEIFNIDKQKVKEVIGKVPLINISSAMYVVIHTEKNSLDEVKNKLIQYGNNYESEWATYMQDQYELVKQRKIGNIGNYVYMVVYEIPEDLIKHIKGKKALIYN